MTDDGEGGLLVPSSYVSPEHYHVVYNIPKDNLSVPRFYEVHIEAKDAYQTIFDLAQQGNQNAVEYYDDGTIGLEMRMKGRADLWWVILEVAACIKRACLSRVAREKLKRSFRVVAESESEA